MTVLTITNAGKQKENDALLQGVPIPKMSKLVVGSGQPPADANNLVDLTAMVAEAYRSDILVVDRLSPTTVKLTGSVPDDVECRIREIGLLLEDDTLFAYAPYMPEAPDGGGTYKGIGFAWTLFVILSREQLGTLEFTYAPIDVQVLAEQIAHDAKAALDLYLQGYFISIALNLSGLAAHVRQLQDQMNSLKELSI